MIKVQSLFGGQMAEWTEEALRTLYPFLNIKNIHLRPLNVCRPYIELDS